MKNNILKRQDHKKPEHAVLDKMRKYLDELIAGLKGTNKALPTETIKEIIAFQYEEGSFNLLDSYHIESDCRVVYCHEPTYICTALLMKALLADEHALGGREYEILPPALHMCCARGLQGHGYSAFKGLIRALDYFMEADVKSFLSLYPDMCPEFTQMFGEIEKHFANRLENEDFTADWQEDFGEDILRVCGYFLNPVFVYGTLMTGQPNHDSCLKDKKPAAEGWITGYQIYDLGAFPGIVAGEGRVFGELYYVTDEELTAMDQLEGEGSLYLRKPVTFNSYWETEYEAVVYVYNHSVEGCHRIDGKYGEEDYAWYVSYGSNLLEERLGYYIQGGQCKENGKYYEPCSDTDMPLESYPFIIPYDMYYSNYNRGSWKRSAVSFLDLSKPGRAYGRAYKIKKSQLEEIHSKEGKGINWYPECIFLDYIDGVPAFTYAGHELKTKEPFDRVSAEYGIVLYRGMKETYPDMSDTDIMDYLRGCGAWSL